MNDIVVANQPILSKFLTKINNTSQSVQAYLLVSDDENELSLQSILFAKVLACPKTFCFNCKKCNICSRIDTNSYSELEIIEPTNGIIKKESIIKLREKFQTSPIEGKKQVYIIKNVELLNQAAANSLLKFLEEPDSDVVAIFTSTNLNKVISTIISRCQTIKLNSKIEKTNLSYVSKVTNLDEYNIFKVLDFFSDIENNNKEAIIYFKDKVLETFNNKELLKSLLMVLLLIYKDCLNYKIFKEMQFFNNETGIKNVSEKNSVEILIKKINFILENLNKIEYNVNITLFTLNVILGIGDINHGEGCRS